MTETVWPGYQQTGFKTAPLLDAYDIYQHLMDYWAGTLQDDCYLIAADGRVAKVETPAARVEEHLKKMGFAW